MLKLIFISEAWKAYKDNWFLHPFGSSDSHVQEPHEVLGVYVLQLDVTVLMAVSIKIDLSPQDKTPVCATFSSGSKIA